MLFSQQTTPSSKKLFTNLQPPKFRFIFKNFICVKNLCLSPIRGVMISSLKMETDTKVQFLDKAVWISHSINTLGEKYASNYSFSSYGLIVRQTGLFNLGKASCLRKRRILNSNLLNFSLKLTFCHTFPVWRGW